MEPKATTAKPFVFPVMKKTIEELFTKPNISKDDIQTFQDRYWEQLVPNFSQALKLLDIHGVPRHNILWSINDRLMDAIKNRIDSKFDDSDQKKDQKLWHKLIKTGMVYIHHPYMRSLIMQVLGKMNSIKERHVNLIVDNKYLYDDAPLPVLRHIWVSHPPKFQEELDKIIRTFQNNWSNSILDALSMSITSTASSTAELVPILYWPPRRRRRDPSVVRIVEMIGESQILYDKTVNILRDECGRFEKAAAVLSDQQTKSNQSATNIETSAESPTKSTKKRKGASSNKGSNSDNQSLPIQLFIPLAFMPNQLSIFSALLCTLRFDLLMSLNEAKIDRLCVPDRIHRFVWCLDACVRNRRIDPRHASELAYHLQFQRRRWAKETNTEQLRSGGDSTENDLDSVPTDSTAKRSTSGSKSKVIKTGNAVNTHKHQKKNNVETEENNSDGSQKEDNLLERDMHMACRDPWVVYTICTSLIRYVLHGLYEDKLPRDIPEVNLLVHLLVLGLDENMKSVHSTTISYNKPTSTKRDSQTFFNEITDINCTLGPAQALISHILPAIAQLQVSTWRAQVCEEILSTSSILWPSSDQSVVSGSSVAGSLQRNSYSKEQINLPTQWQKRIKDVTNNTSIALPSGYLVHPVGYLMLQYHALFALERNELAVLKVLLKAASSAAQSRFGKSSNKLSSFGTPSTPTKISPDSPPPNYYRSTNSSVIFRWRPDVLQALVLGITRLPTSAPAFVDNNHNTTGGGGPTESGLGDANNQTEVDNTTSNSTTLKRNSCIIATTKPGGELGTGTGNSTSGIPTNVTPESHSTSSGPIITRAALAGLLRTSLPLVNDVQLLALAQIAFLVPSSTNQSQSSSNTGSNLDNLTDATGASSSSSILSERERLINTLSRHCIQPGLVPPTSNTESCTTDSTTSLVSNSSGGSYKSSDSRVLASLDALRKEFEKTSTSNPLPLTPTNLSSVKHALTPHLSGSSSSAYSGVGGISNFNTMGNVSDVWVAPSPQSGRYSRPTTESGLNHSVSSAYSSVGRNDVKRFTNSSHFQANSTIGGPHIPIGTPLTNPGLLAATPNLGNLNVGQSNTLLTPRRLPTPPHEFRPPASPMASSTKRARFNPECYTTCPSPAVHKFDTVSEHVLPRTPSPPP